MATLSKRTYPNSGKSVWIIRWYDNNVHRQRSLGDISEDEARVLFAEFIEGGEATLDHHNEEQLELELEQVVNVEPNPVDALKTYVDENFNLLRILKRARVRDTLLPSEIGLLALRTAQAIQTTLEAYDAKVVEKLSQPLAKVPGDNTLMILLGDTQWGKNIPGIFDPGVAKNSVEHYANVTYDLIKEDLPRINHIVFCLLGDMVDGWSIYPGQSFHAGQPVPEQVFEVTSSIWDFVMKLYPLGLPIEIYAVPGNHGRVHKDAHPDTNWDIAVYYQLLSMATVFYQQTGVKIPIVFPRFNDYLNFEIKGRRIHMRHKGPNESTSSSQYASWKQMHNWDVMLCADRHHYSIYEINGAPVIRNSTIMPTDGFTESLGFKSVPSQLLVGVSERHAPSFIYPIFIDSKGGDNVREEARTNFSYKK